MALFNATMIISQDYGRSVIANTEYYITPDENVYNLQTYAGNIECFIRTPPKFIFG